MKNTVLKRILITVTAAIVATSCLIGLCACNSNKVERYDVNTEKTSIMGYDSVVLDAIFAIAIDEDNTYLELDGKGNLHLQIRTQAGLLGDSLDSLLSTFDMSKEDLSAALGDFDISGMVHDYVEPMFPGFRDKLKDGDLEGALGLIQRSVGFNIYGLDTTNNPALKAAVKEIGETLKLPSNLLDIIPADTQLTLTFDNTYYVGEVKGKDGTKYNAIFIGELSGNPYTQPYAIATQTVYSGTDSKYIGKDVLTLRIEFMNVQLSFVHQ